MNARIIKTCSILASERGALIPASYPSLSRWLQAQRAGRRDGWACRRLSAAQMARSVSGLATRRGGTLTSGLDWIRQLSFASPRHLWIAWRNEGVVVLEPGPVCLHVLLLLLESQFKFNTCSMRIFIEYWLILLSLFTTEVDKTISPQGPSSSYSGAFGRICSVVMKL